MDLETVDEIKKHFGKSVEQVRQEFRESVEETRRHFGVVAEELSSKIEAVAEGQQASFAHVDRQFDEVRKEIAETRAMIHLSYVEVDRRLKDLEAGR